MAELLDLGAGHRLRFVVDEQGNRIGAIHEHPWPENPDGSGACSGGIWFDVPAMRAFEAQEKRPPRPKWQIVSEEPLTLSPSIQCRGGCNVHGFVRDGKWQDA